MAKTRKQRESDLKLARQGSVIGAVFVGLIVWGKSHSLMAGVVTFGVMLIVIEAVLIIPGLLRRRMFDKSGIADVDSLHWSEFEEFIATLFQANGYRTRLTPTYDQGGDVIAEGNGERVVVQTKHSTGRGVGNKAVQEAVAAVGYYKGTRAIVVTNRYFTKPAINLAKANAVELWDRDRLAEEILKSHPASPLPAPTGPPVPTVKPSPASLPSPICPRCGSTMVRRHSEHGPFWGCPTFPKCWGTRPLHS
jgi:restriction system protein